MKSSNPDLGRVVDWDRTPVGRRVLVWELSIKRILNSRSCLVAFQYQLEVLSKGAAGLREHDLWSESASPGLIGLAVRVLCARNRAVGRVGEL